MATPTSYDAHVSFLSGMDSDPRDQGTASQVEAIRTTPLFSGGVLEAFGSGILPQYGLLGGCVEKYNTPDYSSDQFPSAHLNDRRTFLNVNTPWSAFICGSQGAGKSHTLSCMLESCIIPSQVSELSKPLAAMVFHYDRFTSDLNHQVCEAAFLCSSGTPVRVLVSGSNCWRMEEKYKALPGVPADKMPEVVPITFNERQLNVSRMMTLMAVSQNDGPMPLYIEVIRRILREIGTASKGPGGLDYAAFRKNLAQEKLSDQQNSPLKLRLDLLESFMDAPLERRPVFPDGKAGRKAACNWDEAALRTRQEQEVKMAKKWSFQPGSLTIVDLSDPLVDESAACALFNICLDLFLENRGDVGRIVALDEAHKYMTGTESATVFTENLLQVIRQQRHLATRVIIATQEPTISPKLLDLSTMTIVHRFTSPHWFASLRSHLAGISGFDDDAQRDCKEIFKAIVNLRTGESLVFCGTAMLDVTASTTDERYPVAHSLGLGYFKMWTRKRLTVDGGRSIMAI